MGTSDAVTEGDIRLLRQMNALEGQDLLKSQSQLLDHNRRKQRESQ